MGIMAGLHQDTRSDGNGRGVQDRLVETAEDLFCRRGFNETSVREIAAAAGCNVASINYYFGGKENLYVEIWRRRLTQMRDARLASIDKVMSGSDQPKLEDLLRSHAVSFLEPLLKGDRECRVINLMAREMIDPHLPLGMFMEEMVRPVMSALGKALIEICPWLNETNVQVVILLLVGQLMHAVCAQEMFEEGGQSGVLHVSIEELVDHAVKFSAGGIRAYAGRNAT